MKLDTEEQFVVKNTRQFVYATAGWIAAPVAIMIVALLYA